MAKVTVTIAVLLFFLALAHARIPLDHNENDVITGDFFANEQESDPKTTSIRLPSQKLEPETATVAITEESESGKSESETNDFFPLTVVNFHPINRRDPSLTLRQRHPCHHHRLGKPLGPSRIHHREMTYGNDMLVSEGDGKKELSEIPAKWLKFPRGDAHVQGFHFWRDDDVANKEGFRRPHHHHPHPHHDHHHHFFHPHNGADGEREREGPEEHSGFTTKIRKFLIHF